MFGVPRYIVSATTHAAVEHMARFSRRRKTFTLREKSRSCIWHPLGVVFVATDAQRLLFLLLPITTYNFHETKKKVGNFLGAKNRPCFCFLVAFSFSLSVLLSRRVTASALKGSLIDFTRVTTGTQGSRNNNNNRKREKSSSDERQ